MRVCALLFTMFHMEEAKKPNKFLSKLIGCIKLMRPHHYLKNGLIVVPLVCAHMLFDLNSWLVALLGIVSFCFLSSAVYIINDLKDIKKDINHPKKCHRPLASGVVSIPEAIILMVVCLGLCALFNFLTKANYLSWIFLGCYLIVNIGYSLGLKRIPILDILLLSSGFFIRLYYGSVIVDVEVSNWLYLTVVMFSFYFGLGKRRNELQQLKEEDTRDVLKSYNYLFLDKLMYVCMAVGIVFYSLWCVDPLTVVALNNRLIWTIPFLVAIVMKYSLDIEGGSSDGDPIEVVLHDKILLVGAAAFGVGFLLIMYL